MVFQKENILPCRLMQYVPARRCLYFHKQPETGLDKHHHLVTCIILSQHALTFVTNSASVEYDYARPHLLHIVYATCVLLYDSRVIEHSTTYLLFLHSWPPRLPHFLAFFQTLLWLTCGECEWIPPTSFSSHIPVHWPSLFYDIEVTLTQPRMGTKVWSAWVSACLLRNSVDRKRCRNISFSTYTIDTRRRKA
ncbi:hypothetical protein L211DRAFT_185214 [Terfezia boudieri ATCC MYA-4762]|uniref:Uncharacterized protein n=1 Tax=Terfezia boudieri ATCC MYA-4762 TaxID=1051890 RepID=A0A3N4LMW4_9PEZI|nr:hypothetical protein L211DRAFT_185214 [Terfezia boudieri ATCC MYA-4762]